MKDQDQLLEEEVEEDDDNDDCYEQIKKKIKSSNEDKLAAMQKDLCVPLKSLPGTSLPMERSSCGKHALTSIRKRTSPAPLEAIMVLKMNKKSLEFTDSLQGIAWRLCTRTCGR